MNADLVHFVCSCELVRVAGGAIVPVPGIWCKEHNTSLYGRRAKLGIRFQQERPKIIEVVFA